MTLPHQCRCAICGEIGVIMPGLPNVFAPTKQHRGIPRGATCTDNDCGCHDPAQAHHYPFVAYDVEIDYAGEERRRKPIVPTDTTPRGEPPYPWDDLPTCVHGYLRCMICKFPTP